jgi:hypothetical protein
VFITVTPEPGRIIYPGATIPKRWWIIEDALMSFSVIKVTCNVYFNCRNPPRIVYYNLGQYTTG